MNATPFPQTAAVALIASAVFTAGCQRRSATPAVTEQDRIKVASRAVSQTLGMTVTAPGPCVVKGTVSHAGKPITAGRLVFYYPTGPVPIPAVIQKDGSYTARSLEPGKARVVVLLDPEGNLPVPQAGGDNRTATARPAARTGPAIPTVNPKYAHLSPGAVKRTPSVPSFTMRLADFAVPPADLKTYQKLHKKYSAPASKELPEVEVKSGQTTAFDIVLK